jgi:hypothetical protein
MTSVESLRALADPASVPPSVLVDMQQEYLAEPRLLAFSGADAVLVNCAEALDEFLDHARRIGLPAAFRASESVCLNCAAPLSRWIDGFEPCRNEMNFERDGPSCYPCVPFAAFMDQTRGGIVMAGFADGSSCLSASIDAFRREHKMTYLCDASASHALDERSADDVHRSVSTISGVYADVGDSAEWIDATTPQRLGNGKQANGMSAGG